MEWRASIEGRVRFDPKRPIDPKRIAQIGHEILSERRRIEDGIRSGLTDLGALRGQISAARAHMRPKVEDACTRDLQAMADFEAAKE